MTPDGPFALLGIMRAADLASAPEALDGAPLVALPVDGVALAAAPAPEGSLRRTRRHMLAHVRRLEALMAYGPVAPMRFGSIVDDAAAAEAALAPRLDALPGILERLERRAEFALRVGWPDEAALAAVAAEAPDLARQGEALRSRGPEAHTARIELGRAVAERLAERRAEAERAMLDALRPLAVDCAVQPTETDAEILRAAFLLPLDAADDFLERARAAAEATRFADPDAMRLRWVGPAPAFSFVETLDGAAANGG